jgi:O-antigen/teichoic acid export membrane protein
MDQDDQYSAKPSLLSQFIMGTFSTGAGKVLAMVLSLVGVMIITRAVPAKEYGSFVILRVVVLFLSQISGLGLGAAIAVFVNAAQSGREKSQIVNSAFLLRVVTIIVLGIIALPLSNAIAQLFSSTLPMRYAWFIPLLFFLEAMYELHQAALQSFHLFKQMGIADAISSVLYLLFILIFVVWLKMGFIGLLQARSIALALALVFQYLNLPIARRPQLNVSVLREMLKFGFPLQLDAILGFVHTRIDTALLGILLGSTGVAYYEVARKIPEALSIGYAAYRPVYFTFVSKMSAEGQTDKVDRVINYTLRLWAFMLCFATLMALLFGRELFLLLFSEQYLPSVTPFVILMGWVGLTAVSNTLGFTLIAIGETNKPVLANIATVIANTATSLTLIPILGATGGAIASVVGRLASNPLEAFFLIRKGIRVDVMTYVKPIFLLIVHVVAYWLAKPDNPLVSSLFIVTFLGGSVLFSIITMSDVHLVTSEVEKLLGSLRTPLTKKSES